MRKITVWILTLALMLSGCISSPATGETSPASATEGKVTTADIPEVSEATGITKPEPSEPPASEPFYTQPAATDPSATEPSVTQSSETQPPTVKPTEPTVTEPPATKPVVTEPPETEPPVTQSPATGPVKDEIDTQAIERAAERYAESIGYIYDGCMHKGNSGYYPPDYRPLYTNQAGIENAIGLLIATTHQLNSRETLDYGDVLVDEIYGLVRMNCIVEYSHTDELGDWYFTYILYG